MPGPVNAAPNREGFQLVLKRKEKEKRDILKKEGRSKVINFPREESKKRGTL
jgi:hypothetical protein